MRRHGEWKETDLNENLTKDISDAIFPRYGLIVQFVVLY